MDLIEELEWRGLVQDIMPGTKDLLNNEMVSGYVGFDPTSDSLHIGSLLPIILLIHLQKAGHKPFALIGGATGMVGDPSGKSDERPMLSEEILRKNQAGIAEQLNKFLNFTEGMPNKAELVNNYDWFKGLSFLDFIRDAGKHITVNYMMAKDSVKKRLQGTSGMSFTEFTYQLVQGYDFYWLYSNHNCKLQMGGSDQWGNIVTGTELIRRKAGGEAFAFTCPLLKKADGGKFGKSEQGNIWLDPNKTTAFQFYQYWLNAADADAESWIKIFTFFTREKINELIQQHRLMPEERILQKELAGSVTAFVHGEEAFAQALATTAALFQNKSKPINSFSVEDLNNIEGISKIILPHSLVQDETDILTLLTEAKITGSKGEARKLIQNNGISLNGARPADDKQKIAATMLLHEAYIMVQKGKKNYYLIQFN